MLYSWLSSLTPSLPQPVKFRGWKVHTYTPANSIFDGPITNGLSILTILIEILSWAYAKEEKPEWFQIRHFYWMFSEWQRGKHGSERVNCEGQSYKTVATAHNIWRERRAEAESSRGPSAYCLADRPNRLRKVDNSAQKCVNTLVMNWPRILKVPVSGPSPKGLETQ